jgi:hypothetical protein
MQPALRRSWGAIARGSILTLFAVVTFSVVARVVHEELSKHISSVAPSSQIGTAAAAVPSPFVYDFKDSGILHESASTDESSSPYWWLDSGGKLLVEDGIGKTLQGLQPASEKWRIRYALANAEDTDDGTHPQNLFRLITRSSWENVRTEASFKISGDNFTKSSNRNESNGLLLMSRYKDSDNLYYAGIRVDGHAVIKKKYDGVYYTMAEKQIFSGEYENGDDKNLLPHNEWIHVRTETVTVGKRVAIKLFMRRNDEQKWMHILSATDDGEEYEKTPSIAGALPLGIRTDFMDVEIDDFRAEKI